jgi:DNA-directed RNA polymerase
MLLAKHLGGGLCDWLTLKEMEGCEPGHYVKDPAAGLLKLADVSQQLKEMKASGGDYKRRLIPGNRLGRPSSRSYLHSDWSSSECVVAGDWMLNVALLLPCFAKDEKGRPCIAPEWQDRVDKICDDLLYRHPVMLPHRSAPKPWAGWWANHGDRLRTSFVRDWRPETRKAIEATFETAKVPATPISGPFAELSYSLPFFHADGIDALKRVPLRINQSLLPIVDKFAVELMDHGGDKRRADRKTVKADLRHAGWCSNENIFLDYNCDRRGRVYSIQQLNYAREDHVRALFEFERGEPLGDEGLSWLEIHCANCGPADPPVDKQPWPVRQRWVRDHIDLIERVAAEPQNNFDDWRGADKPFAFVAACQELVRARRDLAGFITHLPIGFDGTCNGIQHLALLARDENVGRLVNLTGFDIGSVRYPNEAEYRSIAEPAQRAARYRQAGEAFIAALKQKDAETPQDIYSVVTERVMSLLENEDGRLRIKGKEAQDAWCFDWWRKRLHELDDRRRRKLFKNPTMTFPYSVTVAGMGDKIVETYRGLFENNEPWPLATTFLARAVRLACQDVLPRPVRIMKYIRELARHRFKQGKFLEWRTGTGFPVVNAYQKPNVVDLDLDYGGVRSRYTVADGALPEILKAKVLNAASPNFIHSLDATHLIRTVLAANDEGIHDILPVHDSMACLAPHARRFGQIIRREMALLYIVGDPLKALRDANVDDPNLLPLPPRGDLKPYEVQNAEYPFM